MAKTWLKDKIVSVKKRTSIGNSRLSHGAGTNKNKRAYKISRSRQMNTKPKRARTTKGRYKADDKSTPHINEAYETTYQLKDYIICTVMVGVGAIAFLIFN
jgi:hypothetical protein